MFLKGQVYLGVEPKIGGFYPQNGWFIMVPNPIKMADLGGFSPYFWKHPLATLLDEGLPRKDFLELF